MLSIVPGPASPQLARSIAELLGVELIELEQKLFPDGECYLRYTSELKGKKVAVVQSTHQPDSHWLQLMFLLKAAKELGASVVAVVPYFGYARQEQRYRPGEVVSGSVLMQMLNWTRPEFLITVDIHNPTLLEQFKGKAIQLSAAELIARYFSTLKKPFVLAPDEPATERAKKVAELLGCEYDWLEKRRDRISGRIATFSKPLPVKGKAVLIVDDIVSTGKTALTAARIARQQGARACYVACTHAVLAKNALAQFKRAKIELVATDSIPSKVSKLSLAPLLADVLKSLSH